MCTERKKGVSFTFTSASLFFTSPFPACACPLCYCWHCGETQQRSWETDLFFSHSVLKIAGMRGGRAVVGVALICLQYLFTSAKTEEFWENRDGEALSLLPLLRLLLLAPLPAWTLWHACTLTDTPSHWHCNRTLTVPVLLVPLSTRIGAVSYILTEACLTPVWASEIHQWGVLHYFCLVWYSFVFVLYFVKHACTHPISCGTLQACSPISDSSTAGGPAL